MPADEPTSKFIEVSDGRLHALTWPGDSSLPGIVVLPGITSPAATLNFFVRLVRKAGVSNRFLVLDHRGMGLSQVKDSPNSFSDYVNDLRLWLGVAGYDENFIIGHSLGAKILAEADRAPSSKIALRILLDPPMSGPGRRPYPYSLDFYLKQRAAASTSDGAAVLAEQLPNWSDARIGERVVWLPTCSERAIRLSLQGFQEIDPFSALLTCRDPSFIFYGAKSQVFTRSDAEELRSAGARLRFIEIGESGHMIPWDQPHRLSEHLAQLISDLNGDRSADNLIGEHYA